MRILNLEEAKEVSGANNLNLTGTSGHVTYNINLAHSEDAQKVITALTDFLKKENDLFNQFAAKFPYCDAKGQCSTGIGIKITVASSLMPGC